MVWLACHGDTSRIDTNTADLSRYEIDQTFVTLCWCQSFNKRHNDLTRKFCRSYFECSYDSYLHLPIERYNGLQWKQQTLAKVVGGVVGQSRQTKI